MATIAPAQAAPQQNQAPVQPQTDRTSAIAFRVAAIAILTLAAIASFLLLPWEAALGITLAAGLLYLLSETATPYTSSAYYSSSYDYGDTVVVRPSPVVISEPIYFPAIEPRPWYRRTNWIPFAAPRRPVFIDPRPHEPVGVGRFTGIRREAHVRPPMTSAPSPLIRERVGPHRSDAPRMHHTLPDARSHSVPRTHSSAPIREAVGAGRR